MNIGQEPIGGRDAQSVGFTPPIGEPWWTRPLYETLDLDLIGTLLFKSSNPFILKKQVVFDNPKVREMFQVWACDATFVYLPDPCTCLLI